MALRERGVGGNPESSSFRPGAVTILSHAINQHFLLRAPQEAIRRCHNPAQKPTALSGQVSFALVQL